MDVYACDFETMVYSDVERKIYGEQTETWVWAGGISRLFSENEEVLIFGSIDDFMEYLYTLDSSVLYFHNLAFDGSFILDYLLRNNYVFSKKKDKELKHKDFNCSISKMGKFYFIKIKYASHLYTIYDSLKLMPSTLREIGKSFQTKHQKLDMEYKGIIYPNSFIPSNKINYIKNDVLLLREALELMYKEKHNKITIGACCMEEFKNMHEKSEFYRLFPDIRNLPLHYDYTGYNNLYEYILKSYHGGWCYVNPNTRSRVIKNGMVLDVNSLYPFVMSSLSGNRYPFGCGDYHLGRPSDNIIYSENKFVFLRIRTRFKLKSNALPWLHIRGTSLYKANENLVTSDVRTRSGFSRYYKNCMGEVQDTVVELVLTWIDYDLLVKTYDLYDTEYLDYVEFYAQVGMFDEYIFKYKAQKENSVGFKRTLAKLFSNNLYGKFAASDDSSYKIPYLCNGILNFNLIEEHDKKVGYLPVGAATTSYALNYTVRAAINNIEYFCYADTDSLHLSTADINQVKGVEVDKNKYGYWAIEMYFSEAYYLRQKTYAERDRDSREIKVTACGMKEGAKQKFIELDDITLLELGLKIPNSNLKATRVRGGIVLKENEFNIRKTKEYIDKKYEI